jgi:hypothetical protein
MSQPEQRESDILAEVERLLECISSGSDHYRVLSVGKDASVEDIRAAYCKAVEHLHPLKCRDLIERDGAMRWKLSQAFLRIVEAFSTLSRCARRVEYDASINRKPVTPLPIPATSEREGRGEGRSPATGRLGNVFGQTGYKLSRVNDRRRAERFAMKLPVRVRSTDGSWEEVTECQDVSPLGLKLALTRSLEEGSLIHLELPMPQRLRTHSFTDVVYSVDAIVRHAVKNPGTGSLIGVEFTGQSGVYAKSGDF